MKTILAGTLLLVSAAIFPAVAGNQILLRNLSSSDGTPKILVAGKSGQLFVISTLNSAAGQISRAVEVDLNGVRLASLDLTAIATPTAAAIDPQGDLLVTGLNATGQGTVWKVDPQLQSVTALISLPAGINAITTDAAGNIYLTGVTSSASLPVTAGAYQTTPPGTGFYGYPAYAFVTEISPAGKAIYSTYFGSDATSCVGGSFCIGKYGITGGTAIAVDASGAVTIAGTTTATGLPTTPGVLGPGCACGYSIGIINERVAGFVARFRPAAAQQLVWSTFLNAATGVRTLSLSAMALDAAGNVIVGGSAPPGLPTGSGGFQIPGAPVDPNGGGFLLEINSTATAAVWGAYFGSEASGVQAVYVDAQQRVSFSGFATTVDIPDLVYKPTFVARVTSDGKTLSDFFEGSETFYLVGPALANLSTGGFASVTADGALWIEATTAGPSLLSIANSASGLYSTSLSGVELISLYGIGIGPAAPLYGQAPNGVYTSSLGGYQVLFAGQPVPLLYAGPNQINTIVPAGVGPGAPQHIQIVTPSGTIDGPIVPISQTPITGIFQNSQTGLAAALNQNGSINSPSSPAAAGSIVSIFITGNSGTYFPDGSIVPMAIYEASESVWVVDQYRSLAVEWAGAAPGLVSGVMQINFQLPEQFAPYATTYNFSVMVGGGTAVSGTVAIVQ